MIYPLAILHIINIIYPMFLFEMVEPEFNMDEIKRGRVMKFEVFLILLNVFLAACSGGGNRETNTQDGDVVEFENCFDADEFEPDIENSNVPVGEGNIVVDSDEKEHELPAPNLDGLEHRKNYNDIVCFKIVPKANVEYELYLNGKQIESDKEVTVREKGLNRVEIKSISKINDSSRMDEYLFVILDSGRGEAEWGLKPWTPSPIVYSRDEEFAGVSIVAVFPKRVPEGFPVPVVAMFKDAYGKNAPLNKLADISGNEFKVKRGYGSLLWESDGSEQILSAGPLKKSIKVGVEGVSEWTEAAPLIDSETDWTGMIHVKSDITISDSGTLNIAAGTFVKLDEKANIFSGGKLNINGTLENPVVFISSVKGFFWGGFVLDGENSVSFVKGAIFTTGGGNNSMGFGHNGDRQPIFMLSGSSTVNFQDSFIIYSFGQAFGSSRATLNIKNSLVQGVVAGGEIVYSNLDIQNSCFTDIPNDDSSYLDGDNDGLYITGNDSSRAVIKNSIFMYTKDDCIDSGSSGGGEVIIEDSILEACFHEGVALSNKDSIKHQTITNTIIRNCGQGIELGYSSEGHKVLVDHCLLMDNFVGLRYGDNYGWIVEGSMDVTNSISMNNVRDTWNFLRNEWVSMPENMKITDSIFSVEQEFYENNIFGTPEFDEKWRLLPHSIGYKAGSDGESVGLTDQ